MQTKMLNIPSTIDDPSYRYKMPALLLKVEGRGNGIKTKIVNLIEVATALRVPPAYPLKFLGSELGSQTNESQGVINGAFIEPEMRKHLDKFIEKYVLCTSCKYPEMVLRVKHGAVGGVCNSCGTRSTLDNAHKLAAYILKNPPKNSSEFKKEKEKGAEKEKEEKGSRKDKGRDKDKEKEKEKEKDKEKEKEDKKGKHGDDTKGEEKKNGEVLEEAERNGVKPIVVQTFKDIEDEMITKLTQMYQPYSKHESFEGKTNVIEEILQKAKEIVPEEHHNKIPYLIFNAIFDVNIAKQVTKNRPILDKAYEEIEARDEELDILLSLEVFLLVRNSDQNFEKFIPTILKFFYDEDLLSEEFLIDWEQGKCNPKLIMDFRYQKLIDEKFKNASKPLLDWLKEEDDDEEEGEEAKKEGGEDSDIDIDNI